MIVGRALVLYASVGVTTCVVAASVADFDPVAWSRRPDARPDAPLVDGRGREAPTFPPDPPPVADPESAEPLVVPSPLRTALEALDRFDFFGHPDAEARLAVAALELDRAPDGQAVAEALLDRHAVGGFLGALQALAAAIGRTRFGLDLADRIEVRRAARTGPPEGDAADAAEATAVVALLRAADRAERTIQESDDDDIRRIVRAAVRVDAIPAATLAAALDPVRPAPRWSSKERILDAFERTSTCPSSVYPALRILWRTDPDRGLRIHAGRVLALRDETFLGEALAVVRDTSLPSADRADALDSLRPPRVLPPSEEDRWGKLALDLVHWAREVPFLPSEAPSESAGRSGPGASIDVRGRVLHLLDELTTATNGRSRIYEALRAKLEVPTPR